MEKNEVWTRVGLITVFSQWDPNVIKRLSDRVTISVTARDDSGC